MKKEQLKRNVMVGLCIVSLPLLVSCASRQVESPVERTVELYIPGCG